MKFAYSTNIFRLRPLAEAIEGIARAGFCAIEILAERPQAFPEDMTAAQIALLQQNLDQRKMKISSLNACNAGQTAESRGPSWIEEDWKPREVRIRHTLDCMRMAAAMGIPHVVTVGAGGIPSTMTRFDAVRLFVANLQRILPLARKLGIRLLVQPEPGNLIETTEHVLELLKELDYDDRVGINFDVGHFFCVNEDPCEAWKTLKPYSRHVHIGDIPADRRHHHVQLGEGALDVARFLECVEESGYEGYLTIKLEAYDQQPEEVVTASAAFLRSIGKMKAQ